MTISVRLFARARDLAGYDMLRVDLPARTTVAELRRRIVAACPALGQFLPRCAIAVGEDFAADEAIVPDECEVAIIPPVSGGQGRVSSVDESEEKKHRRRHKEKTRVRVPANQPPARKIKRLYRDYGRYVILAIAVILTSVLIWYILRYVMPTLERPPQSD